MNRPLIACTTLLLCLVGTARAEDQTQPTLEMLIGGMLFNSDHSYTAESQVQLPILRVEPVAVLYRYHEITPVLSRNSQTQLLYTRYELETDLTLGDHVRLIGVGGYRNTAFEDRAGSLSGFAVGAGIGSAVRPDRPRLEWSVVAGPYLSRERLDADWWADVHVSWRVYDFGEGKMLETKFRPSLALAADVESSNEGDRIRAIYRIGPVLEVMSANGNRAQFQARWFRNDGNEFLEDRYSGLFLAVAVDASLDKDTVFDARDHRPVGWLPLVWGEYDVGWGGDRTLQRTEFTAEVHDFVLAGHTFTALVWYESRQELQQGDFDNVSYSVSAGGRTQIGLESMLSQGQPLLLTLDYFHRSAHALAPSAHRVPPPVVLDHDSINLLPHFQLQTLGWDIPYRDPEMYRAKTEWLNYFDWRARIGWDFHHARQRSNPAAQLGLNWDAATIQGHVIYARGIGSIGNESPDWQAEVGVRRPVGKVFLRYERYGLKGDLARGNTAVVGIGFYL